MGRSIPAIALVGLKADGTTDVPAVLYRLLRQPQALPGLLRLGRDSARALKTLRLIGSMELLKRVCAPRQRHISADALSSGRCYGLHRGRPARRIAELRRELEVNVLLDALQHLGCNPRSARRGV